MISQWEDAAYWTWQWAMRDMLQCDLAKEANVNNATVNIRIAAFIMEYTDRISLGHNYGDDRKALAVPALRRYLESGGTFVRPPSREVRAYRMMQGKARLEHAFLLRCEGLKYREIGARLNVSTERARQMILKFGRRLKVAMKRTKVHYA